MLTPDITYQYAQAKDVAGGTLVIVNKKASKTDILDRLDIILVIVPADKIFVLSAFAANATTQEVDGSVSSLAIDVVFENTSHPISFQQPFRGEVEYLEENWTGELWVPPSATLNASANFTDDVSTHQLRFSVHGILIPRGNVQQG